MVITIKHHISALIIYMYMYIKYTMYYIVVPVVHILSLCDDASDAPKHPVNEARMFNTFVKIHTFTQHNDNPLINLYRNQRNFHW